MQFQGLTPGVPPLGSPWLLWLLVMWTDWTLGVSRCMFSAANHEHGTGRRNFPRLPATDAAA